MLENLFWCLMGAMIEPIYTYLKEKWVNRKSPLSGTWGQFIYEKDDLECKNNVVKRDRYIISHSLLMHYPQHLRINLNGSINRIRDASDTSNNNSENRRWKCSGYSSDGILMLFYKADEPFDTKGCVYTKIQNDYEYRGYYLADHTQSDGSKKMDMTPVILRKYNTKYALWDWDKTISVDYTVFPWIEYLCQKRKFDSSVKNQVDQKTNDYQKGAITHDQYAEQVGELYALGLKGVKASEINQLAEDYINSGRLKLYANIEKVFQLLHKKKIRVFIASGAPYEIVRCYQKQFHIETIYALRAEIVGGVFTGKVETNYGFNKKNLIERITQENDKTLPYMAFGDSESDYPMLNASLYPFYVSNRSSFQTREFIFIDKNNASKQIVKRIEKA